MFLGEAQKFASAWVIIIRWQKNPTQKVSPELESYAITTIKNIAILDLEVPGLRVEILTGKKMLNF